MKIKSFNFPSFEEWVQKGNSIHLEIGAYYCEIFPSYKCRYSTKYTFEVSYIAKTSLNKFAVAIFSRNIIEANENSDNLKTWYENSISEFNSFWKKHIKETYFDSYNV